MANLPDKGRDPAEKESSPDLNPLLNPALGRNLGRWAEVYFANPPEKREHAVAELLRQLEQESAAKQPSPGTDLTQENPPVAAEPEAGAVARPAHQEENSDERRLWRLSGPPLQAGAPEVDLQQPEASPNDENDIDRLREKIPTAKPRARRSGWLKYVAIRAALVGVFFYFYWQYVSTEHARSSAVKAPSPALSLTQAELPRPTPQAPPDKEAVRLLDPVEQQPAPAQLDSLTEERVSPEAKGTSPTNGERELQLAQDYLSGKNGWRDTKEAAKWLWKGVARHNTAAMLLLADLYVRGDGVPKICAQARLLLKAAASKGSAQAADKLQNLHSSGCD